MTQETQTGLCDNPAGWDGEGGGRGVQVGGHRDKPMVDSS